MADVKWIKMATGMFDNRKIKQIRKLPEGDAIIVIWLQIICLAGITNDNGLVYFSKDIPFTDEMLSVEFDRPLNIIRIALTTFERFGMIEIIDNILLVSNWEKYQNTDGLEKIREQNRIRKQRQRESEKLIECHVTSHADVTLSHATELDLEQDKEIDKDIKKNSSRFTPPTLEEVKNYCMERNNKVDADRFIDFYSSKGWMVGKNKMKDWKACIRTWEKDSKPNNVSNTAKASPNNRFNAFPQREYTEQDYADIEQKMLAKARG